MEGYSIAQVIYMGTTSREKFELITTNGDHVDVEQAGAGISLTEGGKSVHVSTAKGEIVAVHGTRVEHFNPEDSFSLVCDYFFPLVHKVQDEVFPDEC